MHPKLALSEAKGPFLQPTASSLKPSLRGRLRRFPWLAAFVLAATGAAAQDENAGEGETQVFESPYGFRIDLPAGWLREPKSDCVIFRPADDELGETELRILVDERPQRATLAQVAEELARTLQGNEDLTFAGSEELRLGRLQAVAVRVRVQSIRREFWQVMALLPEGGTVGLVFGTHPDRFEESLGSFRKIVESLSATRASRPAEGYRPYRHPAGLILEIPADWKSSREGNRVFFDPPGRDSPRSVLVVTVTAPAPAEADSLDKVEEALQESFRESDAQPEASRGSWLGPAEAVEFRWFDPKNQEAVTQVAAIWKGSLITITLTTPDGEADTLEPVLQHVIESAELH
ncbi:MAG: hypothetical protein HY720_13230 [Planctomycetes bacterium]|nr:hypothetical protein [Planctomycetota bacterium]